VDGPDCFADDFAIGMFGDLPARLAWNRRVIGVDVQGHGRTADIDRPITLQALGDDIAALVEFLDLGQVDLVGYSLGRGGTQYRHPASGNGSPAGAGIDTVPAVGGGIRRSVSR
jgi:pimeloyl-ACP methyl ester carboxylesterase